MNVNREQRNRLGIVLARCVVGATVVGATPFLVGSALGITATGPLSGGVFAAFQGAGVSAGSWMAMAQSVSMAGVSSAACASGAAVGAVISLGFGNKK